MKKIIICLSIFIILAASMVSMVGASDLKSAIDASIKRIDNLAPASFKTKYPDGKLNENYIKKDGYVEYSTYRKDGKIKEHYVHKKTMMVEYEMYYPSGKIAQRVMVDNRFVLLNRFWENGHTKEHYMYTKKDNSTEHYRCDSKGKTIE